MFYIMTKDQKRISLWNELFDTAVIPVRHDRPEVVFDKGRGALTEVYILDEDRIDVTRLAYAYVAKDPTLSFFDAMDKIREGVPVPAEGVDLLRLDKPFKMYT